MVNSLRTSSSKNCEVPARSAPIAATWAPARPAPPTSAVTRLAGVLLSGLLIGLMRPRLSRPSAIPLPTAEPLSGLSMPPVAAEDGLPL